MRCPGRLPDGPRSGARAAAQPELLGPPARLRDRKQPVLIGLRRQVQLVGQSKCRPTTDPGEVRLASERRLRAPDRPDLSATNSDHPEARRGGAGVHSTAYQDRRSPRARSSCPGLRPMRSSPRGASPRSRRRRACYSRVSSTSRAGRPASRRGCRRWPRPRGATGSACTFRCQASVPHRERRSRIDSTRTARPPSGPRRRRPGRLPLREGVAGPVEARLTTSAAGTSPHRRSGGSSHRLTEGQRSSITSRIESGGQTRTVTTAFTPSGDGWMFFFQIELFGDKEVTSDPERSLTRQPTRRPRTQHALLRRRAGDDEAGGPVAGRQDHLRNQLEIAIKALRRRRSDA